MKTKHLTDEQLQLYLDGITTDKIDIERHLRLCEECRNTMQHYKSLYTQLRQDSPPEILSEQKIEQLLIRAIKIHKKESSLWENFLVTVSLAVSIAASFYFFNPIPLLKQLYSSLFAFSSNLFNTWSPVLVRILPILLVVVIILILFDLADRKFIKSRTTSALLKGK